MKFHSFTFSKALEMDLDDLAKEFLLAKNTQNLSEFHLRSRAKHVYSEAKRVMDFK